MCTVSFIPKGNAYVFTSNRDEHISRPSAFFPKEEIVNNKRIVFPKDPKAGGTWFAISESGAVVILLNGAFEKHVPKDNYAKSRGLVVLDIVSHNNPQDYLKEIDLIKIEPFTVLVFEKGELMELRWDGKNKHLKTLKSDQAYIWSSATLYDKEIIKKREELFFNFMNKADVDAKSIIDFHSNNHQDSQNGFIIDRQTGLKTFSVTQVVLEKGRVALKHIDLLKQETNKLEMITSQLISQF